MILYYLRGVRLGTSPRRPLKTAYSTTTNGSGITATILAADRHLPARLGWRPTRLSSLEGSFRQKIPTERGLFRLFTVYPVYLNSRSNLTSPLVPRMQDGPLIYFPLLPFLAFLLIFPLFDLVVFYGDSECSLAASSCYSIQYGDKRIQRKFSLRPSDQT